MKTATKPARKPAAATVQWAELLQDVLALRDRVKKFATDTQRFEVAVAEVECALMDLCPPRAN